MTEIRISNIPSANHYVKHSRGRHFKSREAEAFEKDVMRQLPEGKIKPPTGLIITFVLNKNLFKRDLDNMPKVFIDCLAKKYGFNDSRIQSLLLLKCMDKTLGHEKICYEMRWPGETDASAHAFDGAENVQHS